MNEFFKNLMDLTLGPTIVSLVSILLVGCLKMIPALKNMQNKQKRKAVYYILSVAMSIVLATLYHLTIVQGKLDLVLLDFLATVITEVSVVYPIYENLGIRALIKKLGTLLFPSKSDKVDKVLDTLSGESRPLSSAEVAAKQEQTKKTGWLK